MSDYIIREVSTSDAEALLSIYDYYVKNTAITFEWETPSLDEFKSRIAKTKEKFPYLLIEKGSDVLGYAYASSFHERAAYGWCCELSIYISKESRHHGLGRRLYDELEKKLKAMGILNLYACIAYPKEEDEYLTCNSVQFHKHMGYNICGTFNDCGYKFSRWYDMVWMEKIIGSHEKEQPAVVPYCDIK